MRKKIDTGFRPSPLDHRDLRYAQVAPGGVKVVQDYDFERGRSPLPRYDQWYSPSCVGWSLALLKTVQERLEHRRTLKFDGEAIYKPIAQPEGGAFIRQGLDELRQPGAASGKRVYPITSYAGVAPTNHDEIKHALLTGGVIVGGFNVPRSFMQGGGKEFHDVGGDGDPIVGGHAIAVVGFNPEGVILHNSWGAAWGDNGRLRVTWGFVDTYFDEMWVSVDTTDAGTARKVAKALKPTLPR